MFHYYYYLKHLWHTGRFYAKPGVPFKMVEMLECWFNLAHSENDISCICSIQPDACQPGVSWLVPALVMDNVLYCSS